MTKFFVCMSLLFSLSAMASLGNLVSDLQMDKVVELGKQMDQEGYNLVSVSDFYEVTGIRPKCPCSAYDIKFARYVEDGMGVHKEEKTFRVNIKINIAGTAPNTATIKEI